MKLDYEKSLEDNIRTLKVYVKEIGSLTLSPEEEDNILKNYNETIKYKDIQFKGYYKMLNGKIVKSNDVSNYNSKLDIVIPTTYTTDSENNYSVMIGVKTIPFTTTETADSLEFKQALNDSVLAYVKADANILIIFDASEISISGEKIVGIHTSTTEIVQADIDTINNDYGNIASLNVTSSNDGTLVTLNVINREFLIDKDFEAEIKVATKDVKESELGGSLNSKDRIAEAKVILFKDKIYEAVTEKVKGMKAKETDFESKEATVSEEF